MAELAHFKNFAKLKDTSIEFNDITVLAGKPGTGKSYVMKFMYAIEDSLYQDKNNYPLRTFKSTDDLGDLFGKALLNMAEKFLSGEGQEQKQLKELASPELYDNIHSQIKDKNKETFSKNDIVLHKYDLKTYLDNVIKSIFREHKQISLDYKIEFNQMQFEYKEDNFILLNGNRNSSFGEAIFVETPLILEFKSFMKREKGKTPYHIESLLNILDTDYSFTNEEQDKFIKSFREKSKVIIGGDIESSGDSFIFNREGDKNYDILNASSGIKSIGLLQYLVTNKALKKGSVLFWEEPEVHLHPSWQLKMVDLFVELMNAGVKIVFSTHSPFMGDYLNAISQKNNYRDRVSFNLLKEENEEVKNYILKTDEDWNMIQDELLGSLEDIMWEYL